MKENTQPVCSQADSEISDKHRTRGSTYGPSYRSDVDRDRLSTQQDRLRTFMLQNSACNRWLTLAEIRSGLESRWIAKFPEASVSAQLRHLRKMAFGSHRLQKRRRGEAVAGIYEYLLLEPERGTPRQIDPFTQRKTGLELFDSVAVER
jgi:hypothetical protein